MILSNIGLFALMLILASTGRWFWRTWQVNIPKKLGLYRATWLAALVLGSLAYALNPEDPFAPWAIGFGLLMVYLVSTGAQKVTGESIDVGDSLPAFSATDENGELFDSTTLAGRPVLLKFFRGHW